MTYFVVVGHWRAWLPRFVAILLKTPNYTRFICSPTAEKQTGPKVCFDSVGGTKGCHDKHSCRSTVYRVGFFTPGRILSTILALKVTRTYFKLRQNLYNSLFSEYIGYGYISIDNIHKVFPDFKIRNKDLF